MNTFGWPRAAHFPESSSRYQIIHQGGFQTDIDIGGYRLQVILTNHQSKSKSDLGFSLETHFPTPTHPGKVDQVQLGLPIGNKSCFFTLVELPKVLGPI